MTSPPATDVSLDGRSRHDNAAIIETVGLTKTYPGTDFRAVDELNLRVGTARSSASSVPTGQAKPRRSASSRHG
jgi:hypothetical protein